MDKPAPEPKAELAADLRPTARNKRFTVSVVALIPIIGAAAWFFSRPDPCRRMADTVCSLQGGNCSELYAAFETARGRIPADKCRDANHRLDEIQGMPDPLLKVTMASSIVSEVFGMEDTRKMLHDVLMSLSAIEIDLEKNRPPDEHVNQVLAFGPKACLPVLSRLRDAETGSAAKRVIHAILVKLNGTDLGEDPDSWKGWCSQVTAAEHRR